MNTNQIPLQDTSHDIWSKKYCLRDKNGNAIDSSIDATFERVAKALADVEKTSALKKHWYPIFLQAIHDGAYPAGRIMSNAGAIDHKTAVSLINCTVSNTIEDSMDGIFKNLHEAALTLKAGCGIGYEFSSLRPSGAYVSGAGATTNGPLAFMDVYDKMCFTVSSAGGRRGAQMATFDCFSGFTEILTTIGWINICELVTRVSDGEKLYQVTLDGEYLIKNPFEKPEAQLIVVTLEDGTTLEVTEDHKFEVKNIKTGDIYLKALKNIDHDVEYVHTIV